MATIDCTSRQVSAWKPYGDVELRPRCADDGEERVINLGQVAEVNIAYEIEEDSLPDYRQGQGESVADSQITSMGLGMICHELGDLDVLSILVLGNRVQIPSNAAATQTAKGYKSSSFWLDNPVTSVATVQATDGAAASTWLTGTTYAVGDAIVPSVSNDYWYQCSVAGDSNAGEPTWPTTAGQTVVDGTVTWTCMGKIDLTADVDYQVGNFDVQILSGADIWTGADNETGIRLTVTYEHATQELVQAGMHSGKEYSVRFKGYNKAISDKLMLVSIWRAKSAPPDQLPLIATEYAGANTTFKILGEPGATDSESAFWDYREIQ